MYLNTLRSVFRNLIIYLGCILNLIFYDKELLLVLKYLNILTHCLAYYYIAVFFSYSSKECQRIHRNNFACLEINEPYRLIHCTTG